MTEEQPRKGIADDIDGGGDVYIPQEQTSFLKNRKQDLKIKDKIGKSFTVGMGGEDNKKKIFHCKVCEVTFNDSLSLIDHNNGK